MPAAVPVVTGYYRYTDIFFEWPKSLPNPEDISPLKAALAHDAMCHPDHPFHVEGVKGVQLFIGTYETGHARLLFSSKQVDYIRYWLHAVGLTKDIIPLPYSDCLLTTSSLKTVSKVVYETALDLKNALKGIEKNNKRLKGANPVLSDRRFQFERVRVLWAAQKGVFCSVDFENWEYDHKIITEFGWSYVGWKDGVKVEEKGHYINDGAKNYINRSFVKDHRHNYIGKSETLKKSEFQKRIREKIASLRDFGPVFLVFHDPVQDVKALSQINVDLEGLLFTLPDGVPEKGIYTIDTAALIGGLLGEDNSQSRTLEKMCNLLQIPVDYLHNAGNDAHFTLQAMIAMADGDPIDIQREKRWPQQTVSGVKVDLKPWQEDSDYSDEEGILGAAAKN